MDESDNIKIKRNLNALVEFSRIINSSLDLNFILNNILFTCMGKFFATKALLALKIDDRLKVKVYKGFEENVVNKFPNVKVGKDLFENPEFKSFLSYAKIAGIERLFSSDECIGIICLGEKLNRTAYTKDDIEFLRTILNISAAAIQNSIMVNELKKVNRELDSRISRLNSLFELSKEFGLLAESSRVAKILVYSVIGQFLVSKFAVVTFFENKIEILESKFPEHELIAAVEKYNLDKIESYIDKSEIKKRFTMLDELRIELVVPMELQGKTRGLILLAGRINDEEYSEADKEFIYSVGCLAIISLENRRLFREALEKQKMEEELEIAREIQKNLLPRSIPNFNGVEIEAINYSSKQVGGDYYDIITLDNQSFCTAIADVSGKGVPAALLMANLQAFLRIITKQGMRLDEATSIINDLITENTSDGNFITFFWCIFNCSAKTLNYVNAGHNPPIFIRDGNIQKLDKGGIILGVMKTFTPYTCQTIQLQSGDVLILFTDGITEAMNLKGEEFSDERLEMLALKYSQHSAADVVTSIRKEIQDFSRGTVQSDDITLVVIKVK
jgi:sigma-B regulation protein RsbU (phosphoserine phosphatase)